MRGRGGKDGKMRRRGEGSKEKGWENERERRRG